MRPLGNRVLVEISREEIKTSAGLFIPDSCTGEYPTYNARALAIGKDVNYVKIDSTLLLHKNSGISVGDDLLIISEDDILGIIN